MSKGKHTEAEMIGALKQVTRQDGKESTLTCNQGFEAEVTKADMYRPLS